MTTNDIPTNGVPTNGNHQPPANEQTKELKQALQTLNKVTETLMTDQNNDELRQNVISAAEKLILAAQDPRQQWWELIRHSTLMTAMHVFQEWGAFTHIPEEGSVSFVELGEKINAEAALVGEYPPYLPRHFFRVLKSIVRKVSDLCVRAHRRSPDIARYPGARCTRQSSPHPQLAHFPS